MNAERMVWAHGDNGMELCPEGEVIVIKPIPLGRNNMITPETVAWLSSIRNGGGVPMKLREIIVPSHESDNKAVRVAFDCTPFERYRDDTGPVHGDRSSCYLCNAADAQHPIFDRLPKEDRARLLAAVLECEAMLGACH